ncbi:hypothetical protein [Rhizobium leguminosarum]|uniref:hypothetical protein n=1 Tax=Rhizobium leguminosarum TaxID=384 RepID=UPI0010320C76|nr:hypothetical protein [Rhizobium leguminosarum]TAV89583.1 hypothetical protein ELI22_10355 [Rhizobium leguminosarum]TAV94193.1 hypothetical protein ELI21_10505 [Rhizobium leguminosarum]TAW35268.1 hypothetical protein ELI23_10545 [Rhizobium leguminosarum]
MNPSDQTGQETRERFRASSERYRPFGTVRCSNPSYFRSQLARDVGCLLDVDDDVLGWCCRPYGMDGLMRERSWKGPPPDFMATYRRGNDVYISVVEEEGDPELTEIAACGRLSHQFVSRAAILSGHRLQNAKDLLRYANYRCPLGDRMRIMTALEQEGSATVGECMAAFREVNPMAGLSSLILHRFVTIDLDAELIAPHTVVKIFRSDRNA